VRGRITYANVAATSALVLAMTSGAFAARHYLIDSTSQINPRVLRQLIGRTGRTGKTGSTGPTGSQGPPGAPGLAGAPGPPGAPGARGREGPRGAGLVASFTLGSAASCTLATGENLCFPEGESGAFTPSVDAVCAVSVISQINGLSPGTPAIQGPYLRIAVREGGEEKNDGLYGFYFEGTAGNRSTVQERTKNIPVKAAISYQFGTFYGGVAGEWGGRSASYEVNYTCYGT
jgi:hypothetical protein